MNLQAGLLQEINRVKAVKDTYDEIPEGVFASKLMAIALERANIALSTGDVTEMLKSYKELNEFEY